MASVGEVKIVWSGLRGLPGVSTFHCAAADVDGLNQALHDFYESLANLHPEPLVWTFPSDGVVFDSSSGDATGNWVANVTPPPIPVTASGNYMAPAGYCCEWRTGQFVEGRQVIGKTFMVPSLAAIGDQDGSISGENLAQIREAASTLVSLEVLQVYSHKNRVLEPVASARVPDMIVTLRSRRD